MNSNKYQFFFEIRVKYSCVIWTVKDVAVFSCGSDIAFAQCEGTLSSEESEHDIAATLIATIGDIRIISPQIERGV